MDPENLNDHAEEEQAAGTGQGAGGREVIEKGVVDLIAVGCRLMADPQWTRRALDA